MSHDSTRTCAASWHEALRLAREQRYSTKIKLPQKLAGPLPRRFERSGLSIPNGATAVYRDQQAEDSFQVREFDDHYTVEMDRHNPEKGNAVAHAVYDATAYTAIGLAVAAAALS
ncbi:hypothetical protein [Natrinema thermotolerans]